MADQVIVKVQLPIAPRHGDALIYDRGGKSQRTRIRPLTRGEAKLQNGELRAFWTATWSDRDGWTLLARAPDQDW